MGIGSSGLSDPAGRLGSGVLGASGLEFVAGTPGESFANVTLLAGWNGADGATSFTEESNNAAVATFVGDAQLDTAQMRFGTASLLLDGTVDHCTFPDIAAYALGSADFTIETFVRFNGDPGTGLEVFLSNWQQAGDNRSWWFGLNNNNLNFSYSTTGSDSPPVPRSWNPAGNTWIHVAVARQGDNLRRFADGVQLGSAEDFSGVTLNDSPDDQWIGALNEGGLFPLDGWLDETRISNVAVYTESFTPPSEAFPGS